MTTKPLTNNGPLDLRDVVEIIPALVVCVSPDGSVEFVNRAWQEYTGCSLQQLKESGWQSTIYEEDRAKFTHQGSLAFPAGSPLVETEARLRRADGQYRWFAVKRTVAVLRSGNSKPSLYTLLAFEDINERKESQIKLQQSEASYRVLIETASDAVISADESGTITFANSSTMRIFGYSPLELVGKSLTVLMPKSALHKHANGFRRFLSTGQKQLDWRGAELVGLRKNGQEFPIAVSLGELTRGGHRIFTAFIRDITQQKRAADALRRSQRELRQVIETIPAMVWTALPDGSNALMNRRWTEYTGSSEAGLGWQGAVHPDDLKRHMDVFSASSAARSLFEDEVRFRRADGEYRWFLVQAMPLVDER